MIDLGRQGREVNADIKLDKLGDPLVEGLLKVLDEYTTLTEIFP